jgi:DnaJ-domain-containing protein 1
MVAAPARAPTASHAVIQPGAAAVPPQRVSTRPVAPPAARQTLVPTLSPAGGAPPALTTAPVAAASPEAAARPLAPSPPPAAAPTAPSATASAGPAAGGAVTQLDAAQMAALAELCKALDQMDYFQVLKLTPAAAPAEIKKAFYSESRAYHPDRFFHLTDKDSKEKLTDVYKRITEAYYVLRDDKKRQRYSAEVTGPERAAKLRYTEASEVEAKAAVKKEAEEQIGTHPKGREFYKTAMKDWDAERWGAAERNFKMALTYEPANAKYKEMLKKANEKTHDEFKKKGDQFKIR